MPNEDAKSTLELLRKLQESLLELKRLENEIAATPDRIASLNQKTNDAKAAAAAAEEAVKNERLEASKLDGELKSKQEQLSNKHQATLEVKTNEQLWAIQKEIGFIEENISEIEMKIIQSMEDAETLEEKLKEAKATYSKEKSENDKEISKLESLLTKMEEEVVGEQKSFDELSEQIPQQYAKLLKRIQDKLKSSAMAQIVDDTCEACRVRIRPQMALEVKMGKAIHQCPSCARILFSMETNQENGSEE
jgi:predicted  nucleic acid-binding Zn-ribbon protein